MGRRRRRGLSPQAVEAHVGARVRLRRTLLGMSQEQLGERLGLTFQQVQKYERGANRISAGTLYQLGQILDVPISFFYDGYHEEGGGTGLPLGTGAADAEAIDPAKDRRLVRLIRAWRGVPPTVQEEVLKLLSTIARTGEPYAWQAGAGVREALDEQPPAPAEARLAVKERGLTSLPRQRRKRGAVWDPADIKPSRRKG